MADSVEQEREQKQNFLRDEILSGGYDAMEFKEFLDNLKEDGNQLSLEHNLTLLFLKVAATSTSGPCMSFEQ